MYRSSGLPVAALLLTLSPSLGLAATSQLRYLDRTLNASDVLNQEWYSQKDGMWQHLWWNSGAMLATIGDVALLHDGFKETATNIYTNSLTAAKASNPYHPNSFVDDFYDDEGWWAMGWIKAYDLTKDKKYLHAADRIFTDLLTGNDPNCGGHYWSKARQDNTAIGNELYLAVAASLANRMDDGAFYRKHAQSQLDWFLNSGLINENNTIVDGLNTTSCEARGPVYSYNQGVILGALVEMHILTGKSSYIDTACNIARGAINQLAKPHDGILTDIGYPHGPDLTGAQFKGVFARNLMYLQKVRKQDGFLEFLQSNADSIWNKNRQANGQLGAFWQGPLQNISAAAHSSALDCLVAAAAVSS